MKPHITRRQLLQTTVTGSALYLAGSGISSLGAEQKGSKIISPGCRGTKVRVARIYMGTSHGLWPQPELDLKKEVRLYQSQFTQLKDQISDVTFVVDALAPIQA